MSNKQSNQFSTIAINQKIPELNTQKNEVDRNDSNSKANRPRKVGFLRSALIKKKGKVKSNADGICKVTGCVTATVGSLAVIRTAAGLVPGLVLNINKRDISLVILQDENTVRQGDFVYTKGNLLKIKLTLALFGKIINPIGEIISSKVKLKNFEGLGSVEKKAKGIIDRVPVRKPLMTGIKAVDNLIPIGMGQRELIIGDKQTGKTSIALDTILNYGSSNNIILNSSRRLLLSQLRGIVWFVYCGIGQKRSTISNLYETLGTSRWYTSIVSASASDSAAFQFLAPYTGTTVGEYIRDIIGGDCVVIYDDLSKHAVAYRQMSLLLRRPPGREAYPGDVFYVHSRLLERSGALINRRGKDINTEEHIFKRGTLTALPVIETQAGDVSAYIPTNVISITDGQIFLESELFYKGIHPAINVGLSVSRVGSNAQHALLKLISGSLKVELAQYREVENFATFGAELDEHMLKLLFRGENLIEILKQDVNNPENLLSQIIQLFLAVGLNKKIIEIHKRFRHEEENLSSNFNLNLTQSWLEVFRTSGLNVGVENVKEFLNSIFKFINHTNIGFFSNSRSSGEFLLNLLYKSPSVFLNDIMTSFFLNEVNEEHYLEFYDYRISYYNPVMENQKGHISDSEINYQFRNFDTIITTNRNTSFSLHNKKTKNKKSNKRSFGLSLRLELVNTLLESTFNGYRSYLDGNYFIDTPIDWHVEFAGHPFDEPEFEYIRSRFYDDWTVYVGDKEDRYKKNYVSRKFLKLKKKRRTKGIKTFKWNKFVITRLVYLFLSYYNSILMPSIFLSGFYISGSRKLLAFTNFDFENLDGFLNTTQDELLEEFIPSKELECKSSNIFKLVSQWPQL